jgi:hypothetical protein
MALLPTTAYWKLDEASGNAADATGNGFTLTNNNTVAYAAGKINNGADFGAVNVNGNFSNTNNMGLAVDAARSYSLWVNITTAPPLNQYYDLFGQGYSANDVFYQIEYGDVTGTKRFRVGRARNGVDDPTLTYNVDLGTGTFYHIVYTNNGSLGQTLYVNGASVATNTATGGNGSGGGTFDGTVVSRALFAVARVVNGKMDEIGVWNYVLSAADVTALYNAGAGIQYPFTTNRLLMTMGVGT